MMPDVSQMTTAELKYFISEHRNEPDAVRSALAVILSRSNPENRHPYPFSLPDPEAAITALLKEKLNIQD
jgi:hypothetical protein